MGNPLPLMMQLALTRCFSEPLITAVLVDPLVSNTRVHRLGFRYVDRRQYGDDDCFVYRFNQKNWHPLEEKEVDL